MQKNLAVWAMAATLLASSVALAGDVAKPKTASDASAAGSCTPCPGPCPGCCGSCE